MDRLAIFDSLMAFAIPMLPPRPSVVDLGCGHCLFMARARSFDCRVAGIDARLERVPDEWRPFMIQRKVQEADLSPFDLVLCFGILYHMPLEDQLALVARLEGKVAIVDTHYSARGTVVRQAGGESFAGSTYAEGNGLTSAFGNRESFWPLESELVRMLGKSHNVMKWLPEHHPGRSFYLMLPR